MQNETLYNPWEENITYHTAIDDIEPLELPQTAYREAAILFTRNISLILTFISEANDPRAASYGVLYSLGLIEESQRSVAKRLKISTGTISVYAKDIERILSL